MEVGRQRVQLSCPFSGTTAYLQASLKAGWSSDYSLVAHSVMYSSLYLPHSLSLPCLILFTTLLDTDRLFGKQSQHTQDFALGCIFREVQTKITQIPLHPSGRKSGLEDHFFLINNNHKYFSLYMDMIHLFQTISSNIWELKNKYVYRYT